MNDEQLLRYSRHILMPSMDFEGQQALIDSTVLIVGAGGLGCPAALYLAAAGVGRLILVDFDHVELTNLQRQIAHGMADIGQAKTASLQQSIQAINPDVEVVCLNGKIEELDLTEWVAKIDVVLECSDNLISRYHSNQFCHNHNLPLVSGAAIGFSALIYSNMSLSQRIDSDVQFRLPMTGYADSLHHLIRFDPYQNPPIHVAPSHEMRAHVQVLR